MAFLGCGARGSSSSSARSETLFGFRSPGSLALAGLQLRASLCTGFPTVPAPGPGQREFDQDRLTAGQWFLPKIYLLLLAEACPA